MNFASSISKDVYVIFFDESTIPAKWASFNDFELEEYINERLADYEFAKAVIPAEILSWVFCWQLFSCIFIISQSFRDVLFQTGVELLLLEAF